MSEIETFLVQIGLEKYLPALLDGDVDSVKAVEGLTEADMKELGLTMGARGKLRTGVKDWHSKVFESQMPAFAQQSQMPALVQQSQVPALAQPTVQVPALFAAREDAVSQVKTIKLAPNVEQWFKDKSKQWFTDGLNWSMAFGQEFDRLDIGTCLSNYERVIERLLKLVPGKAVDAMPDKDVINGDIANAMQIYVRLVSEMSEMLKIVQDKEEGYSQLGSVVSAVFDGLCVVLYVRCSLDHIDPVDLSGDRGIDFLCKYFLVTILHGALTTGVDHFMSAEVPTLRVIDDIVAVINAQASGGDGAQFTIVDKMNEGVAQIYSQKQIPRGCIGPELNPAKLSELAALEREIARSSQQTTQTFPLLRQHFEGEIKSAEKGEWLASLIQEVASAIDIKVKLSVPPRHQVIILIGPTGAGKSTLGNWILGHSVTAVSEGMVDRKDGFGPQTNWSLCLRRKGDLPMFIVGSATESVTFLPNIYCLPGREVVLMDFPGFFDTKSCATRLGIDLGFRMVLQHLKGRAHVVAVLPAKGFDPASERGGTGVKHLQKIETHLPIVGSVLNQKMEKVTSELGARCMYAITGCDGMFGGSDCRILWNTFVSKAKGIDEALMVKMNQHLLNQDDAMSPASFVQKVLQSTHVPKQFNSDCLDHGDVETLTKFLSNDNFTLLVYHQILPQSEDEGLRKTNPSTQDWSKLLSDSQMQRNNTERLTGKIDDLNQLALKGKCSLGTLVPAIAWLSERDQPRLNLAIVALETMIMQKILASCTGIVQSSKAFIDQMSKDVQSARLTIDPDLWTEYKKAIENAETELAKIAAELGYQSTAELVSVAKIASVVLVTAGAALLIGTLVSATFFVIPGMVIALVSGAGGAGLAMKQYQAQNTVQLIMKEHIAIVAAVCPVGLAAKNYISCLQKKKSENSLRCTDHGQ